MPEHARSPGSGGPPAARVVLLPGAYESSRGFRTAGFAEAARVRGLRLDLRYADYEIERLADPDAAAHLRARILDSARTPGGGPLWLAGISLGGYVALQCALADPRGIDGVCLLAPYLGGRALIAEIAAAADLAAWDPGEAADDDDRRLWLQLRERALGRAPPRPRLYLGAGCDDRFARAHALLAAVLPAAAVDRIPGAHDWPTWRRLWENFLDSGSLP